jgi:hypothetical protein
VIEALSWCPTGVWIDIEEFFRATVIWHFSFEVQSQNYRRPLLIGRESVSSRSHWRATNGLYILALLWERLASIGALDILYLPPQVAAYDAQLYYPDAPFFSLYDGLKYFRINNLGAFLLGQQAAYGSSAGSRQPCLRIEPDRGAELPRIKAELPRIKAAPAPAGQAFLVHVEDSRFISPADRLALTEVAAPVGEQAFCFDLGSLLGALARGRDLDAFLALLTRNHVGPLPPEVPLLFAEAIARSRVFGIPVRALTVEAQTPELAQLVAHDPKLKRFCHLIGERTIVFPASRQTAFGTRLRELGYILPDDTRPDA